MSKPKTLPFWIEVTMDLETRSTVTNPKYVSRRRKDALLFLSGSEKIILRGDITSEEKNLEILYKKTSDCSSVRNNGTTIRYIQYCKESVFDRN
jgi:hypothetical protein